MPSEVRVPALGESLVEATVGRWLKKPGDAVAAGEPVVELETEKVNLQVSADLGGVLARVDRPEGDTVRVGEVLGTISEATAATAPTPASERADAGDRELGKASGRAADGSATPSEPIVGPPAAPIPAADARSAAEPHPRHASPMAERMAEEHGIDLSQLTGSGPGGRVTSSDVKRALDRAGSAQPATETIPGPRPPLQAPAISAAPSPPPAAKLESAPLPTVAHPLSENGRPEERVRLTRRRQTIARRLLEAQHNAALLTTFNEFDMGAVVELRKRRREAFVARHGVGLGFTSFFVKAAVAALRAFPRINAELQENELVLKHYYDVGIAVDAPGGLVVPVVRDADQKSFAEIERAVADLAKRAREERLTLDDLRGGTFTITNGGVFGSLFSTPIINPPQVAILGIHKIQERAMVVNHEVAIRPMTYAALTYDHRIIDGREAVQFLVRIKELIEDPEALLLDG